MSVIVAVWGVIYFNFFIGLLKYVTVPEPSPIKMYDYFLLNCKALIVDWGESWLEFDNENELYMSHVTNVPFDVPYSNFLELLNIFIQFTGFLSRDFKLSDIHSVHMSLSSKVFWDGRIIEDGEVFDKGSNGFFK